MTSDPESSLFDFAVSNRAATNEEEKTVTDIHAALGTTGVPLRLRRPPVAPRFTRGERQWRRYFYAAATIALALAIALGGFFTTRQDSTPAPTEVPEVVLGLAGQESTAITSDMCDLTGDIPLFVGVNESPISQTSVIVTLDQELKVVCEAQETVLAEDVQIATPTQTPYVLLLMTQTGPMLLNVKTGESLHIQQPPIMAEQTIGTQTWNGWAMLPSTKNPDGIALYLLESFTEIPVMVGETAIGIDAIGGMAIGANDDVVALAITEDRERDPRTLTNLFIAYADGTSREIAAPAIVDLSQIAISPDGVTVALVSWQGSRTTGTKSLSLIDTADGTLINEIEIDTQPGFIDLNWLNDGSALMYTSTTGLYKLSDPASEPELVFEGEEVNGLALTHDDSVVSVSHRVSSDSGSSDSMTVIINLETGAELTIEGRDLFSGSSMATKRSTLLLVNPRMQTSAEPVIVTAVDAITGESLGEFQHTLPENGYFHTSWGYNRDINMVGFMPDSVFRLTDTEGNPAMVQMPAPPIESDSADVPVQITVSPQGMMTLRTYEPNTAWILLTSDAEWIEVTLPDPTESQGVNANIGIILGSDQLSPSTPTATQQSSPIASATCDLTGEIPFIAGLNESPINEPTVLHTTDRSLVVDCDGEQTTLLESVMVAQPTRTPHVIHAITVEGDYFINIVTKEQLFVPARADQSTSQIHMPLEGSWMVMRSSDDETKASVYNLETMTETPIITHSRIRIGIEEAMNLPMQADQERFVLAYSAETVPGTHYLNGFFTVEADGESKLVVTGLEAEPRELAVSPDGQLIATAAFQGSRGEGTTTITLYDAEEDDTIIAQYELQTIDQPAEIIWQHDGSGLLLRDTFNLYRIDAEHPGDGLEIIAEGQNLQNLVLTPDNDVVAISHAIHSQSNPELTTLIVHIPTREVIEVDGHDLWANPYLTTTRTTLVLEDTTTAQMPRPGQTRTLTVVDAVTGESLGVIEFEPLPETAFQQSSYGVGNGDITVVAFRPDSMWKLVDEDSNATLEQITPPPLDEDVKVSAVTIVTSEEGHLSLRIHEDQMQFTAWLLPVGSSEWIQLDLPPLEESQGMLPNVEFIRGDD